ncbi:7TM-DISM domain-containing protein [Leptospira fainei]|nr:7TM-DISM domain-containing protein [Leptospira fainei]
MLFFSRKYNRAKLQFVPVALLLLVCSMSCADSTNGTPNVRAINGVIDLRETNLWGNIIPLAGQWEFRWGELFYPGKEFRQAPEYESVPGIWRDYARHYPLMGHASYKLHLRLSGKEGNLVLRIPRLPGVYSVYLGNKQVFANGITGENSAGTFFIAHPVIRNIPIKESEFDLIVNVSNYRGNFLKGGIRNGFLLGGADTLFTSGLTEAFRDTLLICVIFSVGLYHIVFFVSYRKDSVPALFAIFCLLVSFYTFITSNIQYSLIPELPLDFRIRLEFLCEVAFFQIIYLMMREMYPRQYKEKWMLVAMSSTILFTAAITILNETDVVTLYSFFMYFPPVYTAVLLYGIGSAWKAGENKAKTICLSGLILVVAMINDVTYGLFEVYILFPYSFPVGLVGFIIFNSYLISVRFTEDLEKSKDFADLQVRYNEQLKHNAEEKAKAALEINRSMDSELSSLMYELESKEKNDRSFQKLKIELSDTMTNVRDMVFLMNYQGTKTELIEEELKKFLKENPSSGDLHVEIQNVSESLRIDQCLQVHKIFLEVSGKILKKGTREKIHLFWGREGTSVLLRISQGGFGVSNEDKFESVISDIRLRTDKLNGRYVLLTEKGNLEFELRVPT